MAPALWEMCACPTEAETPVVQIQVSFGFVQYGHY